jgi:hypothetical protein
LIAWVAKLALPAMHPALVAVLVLGPYGIAFFAVAFALRVPEASSVLARVTGGWRSRVG